MIQAKSSAYASIHHWIRYYRGKAAKCENNDCTSDSPKRFEWALRKGKDHAKNVANYIQLCPSCHRKYDMTDEQRRKMSESAKGKTFSVKTRRLISKNSKGHGNVPVLQIKGGVTVNEFESVSVAAKRTKILQSAISNTLTNRAKTAGGFIWQYK